VFNETLAMSPLVEVSAWAPGPGDDVCICGIGARTAVGLSAEASAAAVRGSISGLGLHPFFVDQEDEPVSFAADPAIAPDIPIAERMLRMVQSVTGEALGHAPSTVPIDVDCCWLALPEPRSGLAPNLHEWLGAGQADGLRLPNESVRTLSRGHAGGLMALQSAARTLSRGEATTALVIGVDSYHDRRTIQSLDLRRRLMSERNRSGFPPGEAAGACLLVRGEVAARHRLPVLARIRSAATATEPHPLRSTEPCLGEGLTAVLRSVIGSLKVPYELITASFCDLNGERYRSEEYVYALLRSQEGFVDAHDYISPADCWGDVGAASGPLFAALAIVSSVRGYAKGNVPMLWAGSDSGYRSAVVLGLGQS
jgi:3-oxoacyl-[acyl-carrier-protein] synthase-1